MIKKITKVDQGKGSNLTAWNNQSLISCEDNGKRSEKHAQQDGNQVNEKLRNCIKAEGDRVGKGRLGHLRNSVWAFGQVMAVVANAFLSADRARDIE